MSKKDREKLRRAIQVFIDIFVEKHKYSPIIKMTGYNVDSVEQGEKVK